jgi:hypothetical protein
VPVFHPLQREFSREQKVLWDEMLKTAIRLTAYMLLKGLVKISEPGKQSKAPFVTAPVIDKATSLGLEHRVRKKGDKEFHIYFFKTDEGSRMP